MRRAIPRVAGRARRRGRGARPRRLAGEPGRGVPGADDYRPTGVGFAFLYSIEYVIRTSRPSVLRSTIVK